MISVILLGTGNVSKNLFNSLINNNEIEVLKVIGRTEDKLTYFKDKAKTTTEWQKLPKADVCILAINDDAIEEISETLNTNNLIVHTSGSVALEVLGKHKSSGVFYPLQTFTAKKIIPFDDIPICIEAKQEKDLFILQKLGSLLSNRVTSISSEKRKALHLSAVFVNNFTNYLYTIGNEICEENEVDFTLLRPLIKETASKLDTLTPVEAQTGPARRGDMKILHTHLKSLVKKEHRDIYKLMSNAIKAPYGEEL